MIKIFQEEDKSLISKEYSFDDEIELESGSWIHIEDPTVDVLNKISKLTGISNTFLLSALDEEESSIKEKVHSALEGKLDGKQIVKEIYIKNKIYNVVVK